MYAERVDDTTFDFVGVVAGLDDLAQSPDLSSAAPSVDNDGNIYFLSGKTYGKTDLNSIYDAKLADGAVGDVGAALGISKQQTGWFNMDGEIAGDGKTFYVSDNGLLDDGSFTRDETDVMKNVNDGHPHYGPDTSADELELFYAHNEPGADENGILLATRTSTSEPFGKPQLILASGNDGFVEAPSIAADDLHLYLGRGGPNGTSIFVATRQRE